MGSSTKSAVGRAYGGDQGQAGRRPGRADAPARKGAPARRAGIVLAAAAAAAVSLAACSSSSTTPSSSGSATTASSSSRDVVRTSSNSMFGTILVSSDGRTLYTFTNNGRPVSCTGACASVWPPLTLPSGVTTPEGPSGVTGLGVVSVDGTKVVTHNGLPLYEYAGDASPGQVNGNGVTSFGGTWHVAKASGSAASPSASSSGSAGSSGSSTTSGGGGGSGY